MTRLSFPPGPRASRRRVPWLRAAPCHRLRSRLVTGVQVVLDEGARLLGGEVDSKARLGEGARMKR